MMTFNDFFKKYDLKNKGTSNIKNHQVLSSLPSNDVGIYLRNGPFESDIGVVYLHPSKETHWVCYINENFLIHMVVFVLKKLSKIIIKQNGYCSYSEYQIQEKVQDFVYK